MKTNDVKSNEKKPSVNISQRAKERNYWLKKLSGDYIKSSFPYDTIKRKEIEPLSKSCYFSFDSNLNRRIMQLCNKSDIRLYIILMTGVILLMDKYTGNKDIVVGAPIYRQDMDGDFINKILVLRTFLKDDMSFKELLLQVSQNNLEAVEHVNYPLETIPFELDLTYDESEFPLFDIAVLLENIHDKNYLSHINLDVIFRFYREDQTVKGEMKYNAQLYEEETIKRIMSHFIQMMNIALFEIDCKISNIPMMPEEEIKKLILDFNTTEVQYPRNKTIQTLFKDQVENTPNQIVLECDNERLTYKELDEKSDCLAHHLINCGVRNETIVAVLLNHSIQLITSIIAILKAGGAYLPIDPEYPVSRIHFFLNDSRTQHLITSINFKSTLQYSGTIIEPFNYPLIKDNTITNFPTLQPDNLAYIIYTSGTTGKPKGVMIQHGALLNYVWWAANTYLKGRESVSFPLYSSISFDLTVTSIFTPLITGNKIIIYQNDEQSLLIDQVIEDKQAGIVKLTPSHLDMIKYKDLNNSSVKCFIVGGEILETSIAKEIHKLYNGTADIYNEYGPTETTVGCLIYRYDPKIKVGHSIPIGIPINNTQIYLLDRNRKVVPIGVTGEIYVSGDGIARGYLNNPEMTIEKFVPNPFIEKKKMYRTGDLACMLPDGNIEFIGRVDQQVKIRGYRIELSEIEQHLTKHKDIEEAVVIARDWNEESGGEEKIDQYLCAYYISKKELQMSELNEFLSEDLPDYMVPLFYVPLEEIPLTSNGKLNKKALPAPEIRKEKDYVAPRNDTEKKLVYIWAEVLRIDADKISIDASFFELGGQSLKQVYLISQIHKSFDIKINHAEIFRRQTIRELAEFIKSAVTEKFIAIEPAEEREYYVLSAVQKRLYILRYISQDETLYNVPTLLTLQTELDKDLVQMATEQLIHRHEALRTSFIVIDDEPVQRIEKEVEFNIEYHDFSDRMLEDRKSTGSDVKKVLNSFIRPFDLSEAPIFRVGLVKLEKKKYVLMLDIHHIISDGVSTEIMARELSQLYNGSDVSKLPLLPISYKDYAVWQNKPKQQERLKKQEEYWLMEFQGEIPVLNIHPDFPRPAEQTFDGGRVDFLIGTDLTESLNRFAVQQDVTLYMILVTAFNIALSKVTRQEDIILGTSVAARSHADLEMVFGMFVNTLVLRNFPKGEFTVSEFMENVKQKILSAFENQDYQFDDLVEKLDVRKDVSRNPVFDVMFSWFSMFRKTEFKSAMELPTAKNPYNYNRAVAKFDMSWLGYDLGDKLDFSIEYATRLFREESVLRIVKYFKRVLSFIIKYPESKLSEIDVLSDEEKNEILFKFNNSKKEYPREKTVYQLFEEQVARTPEHIAIVGPRLGESHQVKKDISYKELNIEANRLASFLREKGVKPNTIVGLMIEHSIDALVNLLAILKSGGAYLPIDPSYPLGRIEYMIESSGISIVLTHSKIMEEQTTGKLEKGRNISLINVDDLTEELNTQSGENLEYINILEDLIYIIFTSGSTGVPKGAGVYHKGFTNLIYWFVNEFQFGPEDSNLLMTSLSFDLTGKNLYSSLLTGGKVKIPQLSYFDPPNIIKEIKEDNVSWINCTPSMCYKIVECEEKSQKNGLSSLRYVFLGGEPISMNLLIHWLESPECNAKIVNTYGPTECTDCTSSFVINEPRRYLERVVPIGKPLNNVKNYIMSPDLKVLPVGVPGELMIGGQCMGAGYINDKELTNKKFLQIPQEASPTGSPLKIYRTGDLAVWLPDGNVEFLGRIDHQVKIRGYRIELGEIEAHLLKHPNISEVVVTVKSSSTTNRIDGNDENEKHLFAYLVTDAPLTVEDLKNFLSGMLPPHMIPTHFIRLDSIPLNENGKINRIDLENMGTPIHTTEKFVAPQNELEKKIAAIWQEVLRVERVGLNDNFFDIGGTSLDVITIINRVNKTFNVNQSVVALFRYSNVHSFAQYIGKEMKGEKESSTTRTEPSKLTFEQVKKSRRDQRNKRRGTNHGID